MKGLLVWLLLSVLSIGSPNAFADPIIQKGKSGDEVCSTYLGRMIRAANRFDAPTDSRGKRIFRLKGETTEDVLTELINSPSVWGRFNFEQKKEFVFVAITYADAQGGELTALLILLGREATLIASELGAIPDGTLRERYLLSDEGMQRYRSKISFLRGQGAIHPPMNVPLINQK